MKFIKSFSVSATVAGAFIGAGFASGQELLQFFGEYGKWGLFGLALAVSIMVILAFMTIKYAIKKRAFTFEEIIFNGENKFIKTLIMIFEAVLYFSIYTIMTAGASSLLFDIFSVSKIVSAMFFATLVTLLSFGNIKRILSVFSAITPILVLSAVVIAIISITKNGISIPHSDKSAFSALFSALVYVSYNFVAGMGVFASLGRILKKESFVLPSGLSFSFLIFLSGSILLGIFSAPQSASADLPMMAVAGEINDILGLYYAFALILAMIGASVSSLFPLGQMVTEKRRPFICALISIFAIFGSILGFKELISSVYPIFGYIGFIVIVAVIYNFRREKQ